MRVVTGAQIRMARAYLGWSAQNLADNSDVGISTVKRIEAVDGYSNVSATKLQAVTKVLEETGKIVFKDDCCVCVAKQEE